MNINEIPLLPKEEISRRLRKLRLKVGQAPQGNRPTMKCIEKFTGLAHCVAFAAMHGQMTDRTQLTLSHFYYRYDAGEISFTFGKGGWKIHFHSNPESKKEIVTKIEIGDDGPKLGFIEMNRTWV